MLEIKKTTSFHLFALKTDNSLFCHLDIPTIHNSYCVSNAVVLLSNYFPIVL